MTSSGVRGEKLEFRSVSGPAVGFEQFSVNAVPPIRLYASDSVPQLARFLC